MVNPGLTLVYTKKDQLSFRSGKVRDEVEGEDIKITVIHT